MRLFNEKNSKFSPDILAYVDDDDVIVNRINKDYANYKMDADYEYDGVYLKEPTSKGNRVELPIYSFRYSIKYPTAKVAAEAGEEFKKGRTLDFVFPQYDPKGIGRIFSKRKTSHTVEFELIIPGTLVWDLMKKRKAESVKDPQRAYLDYLEEFVDLFVNDDREFYG